MEATHLESNLTALLQDVNSMRPKREGRFVTRVLLKSPPSGENLKINPFLYIPEEGVFSKRSAKTTDAAAGEEEDAEQEEEQRSAASGGA